LSVRLGKGNRWESQGFFVVEHSDVFVQEGKKFPHEQVSVGGKLEKF
jgi:hypothetical protein